MSRSKSVFAIAIATASVFAFASIASAGRGTQKTLSGNAPTPTGTFNAGAEATYVHPTFSQAVGNPAGALLLSGIPAGTYTSYTVSLDWSPIAGDPWSNEAIWALTDAPLATATTFYADPGVSPAAAGNGNPTTLTWNGSFDVPYTAPANGDLYFLTLQTFGGSSANWNNISISLGDNVAPPPASTSTVLGGSISAPLAAGGVQWFDFTYSGTGAINLDTIGTNIASPSGDDVNDTEIALFSADGTLISTNDDIDFLGGIYTSSLSFASGDLAAGDYYVAVTGFNGTFGSNFAATSNSLAAGTIVVNGISVPEPTSLASLALVGLIARRRRA